MSQKPVNRTSTVNGSKKASTSSIPTNLTTGGAVKKNAKGGVLVNPNELHTAFEFFDSDNKGYITMQDLRDKLGIFYKNLSTKDYKLLMQNKTELTEQDLYQLLVNNELTDFDPSREAFKIYAPYDNQSIDRETIKEILVSLGFADITDNDVDMLMDTLDTDRDGLVGWEDFKHMIKTNGSAIHRKTQ